MRHKFRSHVRANAIGYMALFVALGGTGAYAAVGGIPDSRGVFHGCVNSQTGALRVVKSARQCHKSRTVRHGRKSVRQPGELAITWNQQGQRGDPGTLGAKGDQGAQGPGATTFTTTVASGAPFTPFAKLSNGVTVGGTCTGGKPTVTIETTSGLGNLEASGTGNADGVVGAPDAASGSGFTSASSGPANTNADLDMLARDKTIGKFAHIDVHGDSSTPCSFWGMIIPSG